MGGAGASAASRHHEDPASVHVPLVAVGVPRHHHPGLLVAEHRGHERLAYVRKDDDPVTVRVSFCQRQRRLEPLELQLPGFFGQVVAVRVQKDQLQTVASPRVPGALREPWETSADTLERRLVVSPILVVAKHGQDLQTPTRDGLDQPVQLLPLIGRRAVENEVSDHDEGPEALSGQRRDEELSLAVTVLAAHQDLGKRRPLCVAENRDDGVRSQPGRRHGLRTASGSEAHGQRRAEPQGSEPVLPQRPDVPFRDDPMA